MKNKILIILISALSLQVSARKFPGTPDGSKLFLDKKKGIYLAADAAERTSKQVIKLNIIQLCLTNPTFQYEYGFHKNMSAALGFGYLVPRSIPTLIFKPSTNVNNMKEGYDLPKFGGWSVTPEFRFYPGKKEEHQAPHGFYIAPYFRYAKYTLSADYYAPATRDANGNTLTTRLYKTSATYAGFTGGLMIGSQWIIGKHFSIDWWIVGGGFGKAKLTLESKSDDPTLNLSAQEQANLKTDINTNLGELQNFSNGVVDIQTTSNSAKATIKGIPMSSFRGFGLNLGFAF